MANYDAIMAQMKELNIEIEPNDGEYLSKRDYLAEFHPEALEEPVKFEMFLTSQDDVAEIELNFRAGNEDFLTLTRRNAHDFIEAWMNR